MKFTFTWDDEVEKFCILKDGKNIGLYSNTKTGAEDMIKNLNKVYD